MYTFCKKENTVRKKSNITRDFPVPESPGRHGEHYSTILLVWW
jgi:hypothetical protein